MERNRCDYWLCALLAGLGICISLSAGSLTWLDPDTALLGCVLLALTTVVAVTDLFPHAGWVVAGVGSVLYVIFQIVLWGPTVSALANAGAAIVGLLGTALFSSVTSRQLSRLLGQLERDRRLISELTVHDPKTGLMKLQYARQTLQTEIARSRRYRSDLSLLLMRAASWDDMVERHGTSGADALMVDMVDVILDSLRVVDTPFAFDACTVGAVLPEVPAEGARVAAQRLIDNVARRVRVATHVGITHFPDDAVTRDELFRAAEAALDFGMTSGRPIVSYGQLRSPVEGREEEIGLDPCTESLHERADLRQRKEQVSATIHPTGILNS